MQQLWSAPSARTQGHVSVIDPGNILHSAQIVSGNFKEIDPALHSRVVRLANWVNDHAPLTPERKSVIELQIRKILVNRLKLAADRERLPGIAQERVERPIIVIGFARTGTTLVHSLLAEDPDARAPLRWHSHDPSPPPGEVPIVNMRIEFAGKEVDRELHMIPGLLTLHPYWDKRGQCPIEDEEIFTLDFQDVYPSLLYQLPAMPNAVNSGVAYSFHRQFLQHLQWNEAPKHWVVKGVFHQFALDALFETYPDALCIWPHRDPVEVCPSLMALLAVIYGAITDWTLDFKAMGPGFVESIRRALEQTLVNPLIDHPRIVHVDFRTLTRDPIAVIEKAYDGWGKRVTPEFAGRMRAWLSDPANRSDRYGRYPYSLEAFGLSAKLLETSFAAYRDRFGLIAEARGE